MNGSGRPFAATKQGWWLKVQRWQHVVLAGALLLCHVALPTLRRRRDIPGRISTRTMTEAGKTVAFHCGRAAGLTGQGPFR